MKLLSFLFAYALDFFSPIPNFVNSQDGNILFPSDNTRYENSECNTSDGFNGVCKKMSDCPINRFKATRSNICSFMKNNVIYCCENEMKFDSGNYVQVYPTLPGSSPNNSFHPSSNTKLNISSNTLSSTSSNNTSNLPAVGNLKPLRPAEASCELYYPFHEFLIQPIFIGGNLSLADEHPHMAAIGWTDADGVIDWRCGGSVIAENFIITAAHCTISRETSPDVVRTGDLNLLVEEKNVRPQNFYITDIFVNPGYTSTEIYHDIGLIKFTRNSNNKNPYPACLWLHREIPVEEVLGMGYGTTQFAGPRSNELYQGYLTIVPNNECSIQLPVSTNLPKGIIQEQLCAQDPEHKKDTCQGDSGGPIQFYVGEGRNRKPMIAGITSFGENCAGGTPGVYTRISEYIDWIESVVWPPKF